MDTDKRYLLSLRKKGAKKLDKMFFPHGGVATGIVFGCPAEMVVIEYISSNGEKATYICPWADVDEIIIESQCS